MRNSIDRSYCLLYFLEYQYFCNLTTLRKKLNFNTRYTMSQLKNNIVRMLFLTTIFLSGNSFAADLVVQDAGPLGTYATIASAVAASVDGDRIIINNKPSGLPWNEDIFINKSLTFLSAADNDQFFVQGEYTIQHAPGREISIIGMENADGSIASIGPGATSRTILNVMWCTFTSGGVDVDHAFFELNLASCKFLTGGFGVSFVYGKVIGSDLGGAEITLISDGVSEEDSVHVVGNSNVSRIICNTNTHYIYVSNNYVSMSGNGGSNGAVRLQQTKSGVGVNVIRNNSIRSGATAIRIEGACTGKIAIYNNLIDDYSFGDYGIYNSSSATLTVSFNFIDLSFDNAELVGIVNDGTNTLSGLISINATDGSSNWVGTIDGGSPSLSDYDLNLTRNDPGCFGGSYSHTNFFPIDGTSSKVYYLKMPAQILVGGSNAVTGYSFDR